jgi:hypothetical protein
MPLPQRGLGQILSAAFEIYKANAAGLLKIVAIVVVPLTFISAFLTGVVFKPKTVTVASFNGTTITGVATRSIGAIVALALIGAIIGIIITAILQAALFRGAAQATISDPVDIDASFKYGFRRFGSVVLLAILVGLIVGGGALVIALLGIVLKPVVVLFVFAAIIWAIFASTQLSMSIPSLIVENKRGFDALSRSWNLVKSHFWHVLGTIVVAGIITGIIGGVIGALGGSNWFLGWITSAIAQILTAPFTALVTLVLYLDLRSRSESLTADTLRSELHQS